jgi:uncharacterized protein YprB with RNaseH-like and TPR domain
MITDLLRQQIASIERKWRDRGADVSLRKPDAPAEACATNPAFSEVLGGAEQDGCLCVEKTIPLHRRHGNADISALRECDGRALGITSPPRNWAFLDTETSGLAGGTGTYAFLIGIGELGAAGFRVRQYFMRDFSEEPAQLRAVEKALEPFDTLVTYNGKTFDVPLLETRFRMNRCPPPLERLAHLDLLHSARRLWKLRLKSCRLVELEAEILGFVREGDLAGEFIPAVYFDYLRTSNALPLVPLFHHNRMDIVTLACLTAVVAAAIGDPERAPLTNAHDLLSLARWIARMGRPTAALDLYARALRGRLSDEVTRQGLLEMAALHKRRRDYHAALPLWEETGAWEELAKYHEHRNRDLRSALDAARRLPVTWPGRERRVARLERRLAGRLL